MRIADRAAYTLAGFLSGRQNPDWVKRLHDAGAGTCSAHRHLPR